jgi:hypothetical protein
LLFDVIFHQSETVSKGSTTAHQPLAFGCCGHVQIVQTAPLAS